MDNVRYRTLVDIGGAKRCSSSPYRIMHLAICGHRWHLDLAVPNFLYEHFGGAMISNQDINPTPRKCAANRMNLPLSTCNADRTCNLSELFQTHPNYTVI